MSIKMGLIFFLLTFLVKYDPGMFFRRASWDYPFKYWHPVDHLYFQGLNLTLSPHSSTLFFALFSSTFSPETPDCSTWLTGSTCNLNPAHTAPHSPTAGLRKNPKLTFPPFSQGAVKNSRKPFNYRCMEVRERERERKNGERQSTVQVPGVFLACPEAGSHNGFSG